MNLARYLSALIVSVFMVSGLCAQGFKTTLAAAEKGDAGAQFSLGFMYSNGKGVPKDYTEAAKWFRKAAGQGEAQAQFNLGVMYAKGEGVPKNLVEAYAWWNIAGSKGNQEAQEYRDSVEKKMTPAQIHQAQERTKNLMQESRGTLK